MGTQKPWKSLEKPEVEEGMPSTHLPKGLIVIVWLLGRTKLRGSGCQGFVWVCDKGWLPSQRTRTQWAAHAGCVPLSFPRTF